MRLMGRTAAVVRLCIASFALASLCLLLLALGLSAHASRPEMEARPELLHVCEWCRRAGAPRPERYTFAGPGSLRHHEKTCDNMARLLAVAGSAMLRGKAPVLPPLPSAPAAAGPAESAMGRLPGAPPLQQPAQAADVMLVDQDAGGGGADSMELDEPQPQSPQGLRAPEGANSILFGQHGL